MTLTFINIINTHINIIFLPRNLIYISYVVLASPRVAADGTAHGAQDAVQLAAKLRQLLAVKAGRR